MKRLIAIAVLTLPIAANANVIIVSGNSFDDMGGSTVDLQTGLQWLDIVEDSRNQCSIFADIGADVPTECAGFVDGLDLFDESLGYRYATQAESTELLTNWFGGAFDPILAQLFLDVFAGGVDGVRWDAAQDLNVSTNPLQAIGGNINLFGFATTNFFNGSITTAHNFAPLLVRDAVSVPEPGTLALLGLGLFGMGLARRRKTT